MKTCLFFPLKQVPHLINPACFPEAARIVLSSGCHSINNTVEFQAQ